MDPTSQASFERCCRLCAKEHEASIMIFSEEAENMLIMNKLNKYLLIEVDEDDKLPKNICIQCCLKLKTVCDFIDTARRSQEMLLRRSFMFDEIIPGNTTPETLEIKLESDNDNEYKYTQMEVSVDPMMVLQNSEETMSPHYETNEIPAEDVTYMYNVDTQDVSIKFIKKGEKALEIREDKDAKPFPCSTCRRSFYSELALKNHSWNHINEPETEESYSCNSCSETFEYKSDLVTHLKEHKASGTCQLCGRVFRSEKTYTAHMSVHLPSHKSFKCKVCGRIYNTWSNLKTHSVSHSADRPYQCHYCKKTFKRNQDLKFHINQHTGARPYKCPFCEKCFASSGNCYSHRNRMHPGKCVEGVRKKWPRENVQTRPIFPKASIANIKGIFKYQCQLCHHTFMKRDNFTYHMYQHTGEKPFQCSFCSEKFVTRRGLLLHHEKEHPDQDRPLALLSKNLLLK